MRRFLRTLLLRLFGRGPTLLEVNGKLIYCRNETERKAAIKAALKLRSADETLDFKWTRV